MNDTTVIGSAGQVEDVRAYVRAVRAWLGDLPADEVEDLVVVTAHQQQQITGR